MGEFQCVSHHVPMVIYPLKQINGHIIVMLNGRNFVLDTGSPFSVVYGSTAVKSAVTYANTSTGTSSSSASTSRWSCI